MVFNRIAEIISSTASRLKPPKSSAVPYASAGLPPPAGSVHGFSYSDSGQRHCLRLSSSLQDFSAYRTLAPEESNLIPEFKNRSAHAKQSYLLQRENVGSSFSKERASPGIPLPQKKWFQVIMVLLGLLLFAFLIYALLFFYFNWFQEKSQFYVVLDCGSTGTRVYVYQASINHEKDSRLPLFLSSMPEGFKRKSSSQRGRAYNRMETEPGFDKLVRNISGLRRAINPLLRWAEKQIPKHAQKKTSLFLYATAGVRRLPSSDSEWLLNNAWSILKSSPFLCQRDWVKIISGVEEAYYGWIALNYHNSVLGAMPKKQTFGALDLGGSSLQVTFESKKHVLNETNLKLRIGPVSHNLIAYSLSGYGLNDAFGRSVVHLFKRLPLISNADIARGNIEIKHPCLHSGYREQYLCSHCALVDQEGLSPLTGTKNLGKDGKPGVPVRLIGAPKWEECSALAKVTVNFSEWSDQSQGMDCESQPCALADNLPHPYGQFYAMSGFFVVYRFFNLTSDAALDDVLKKGKEFCEKTWDIAKNSVAPQPFIEQYCFRAPYIVSLLREGLHITDDNVLVGSGSITWTLGVALLEAGKAFPSKLELQSYEILRMKISPIVLFAILFASLLLLVCALSCVGNWMPKLFRRSYLPLWRNNSGSTTSVLNIPSPFRFQHWSPINSGDGRAKMPLSPTVVSARQSPFGMGHGIQLADSSFYSTSTSVAHSYSSGSLGQIQFDNNGMGSFWSPLRSHNRLQSRRSQSREDLNSSLADPHLAKV